MDQDDRPHPKVTLGGVALAPGDHLERLAHAGDLMLTEPGSGHLRDEFAPDALFTMLDGWSRRKLGAGAHPFGRIVGDLSWAAPRLSATLIIPMIKAHPKVWMAGTLVENPYYVSSTEDGHHPDSERRIPS